MSFPKNKKILVITPFFAPETHAAVFRAHKLVKYLKKGGWDPHVLTVDINYVYNEDPNLINELENISIYRARYIEPSLRGILMFLGGRDRTLNASGKKKISNQVQKPSDSSTVSLGSRFYKYLIKNYLQSPDRFWTWKRPAISMAKQIIKKEGIELIYTTCLPFTCNQIGIDLKKKCNVNWVADFRDPITYASRMHSSNPRIFTLQRKIQDSTFHYADKIIGLSSAYPLIFNDQYEGKYDHKVHFIPTGLDDSYLPEETIEKENHFLFIGEYLKEYEGDFFRIYKKVMDEIPANLVPKIMIIGRKDINEGNVFPILKKWNLESQVSFLDHMPQKELYKIIEKARFVLLINGARTLWWTNFAKLVDYIALKKQVVAMVPTISEARSELIKANLGIFLDGNETINKGILKSIILKPDTGMEANDEYCQKYLASSQTKSFLEIFENMQK